MMSIDPQSCEQSSKGTDSFGKFHFGFPEINALK